MVERFYSKTGRQEMLDSQIDRIHVKSIVSKRVQLILNLIKNQAWKDQFVFIPLLKL